jgi:hypothetical protein
LITELRLNPDNHRIETKHFPRLSSRRMRDDRGMIDESTQGVWSNAIREQIALDRGGERRLAALARARRVAEVKQRLAKSKRPAARSLHALLATALREDAQKPGKFF